MQSKRKVGRLFVAFVLASFLSWAVFLSLFVRQPTGIRFGKDKWVGLLPLKHDCCVSYSGCPDCGGCGEGFVFAYRVLWFTYVPNYAHLALR